MSCLLLVDCVKEKAGGLIRGLQVQKGASGRGLLKTTFTEGGIGIFGLLFWLFFKSVFWFFLPKNYDFLVWCSLRSVDFPLFSIWFSVFVKNVNGFLDLVLSVVFVFRLWVLVSFRSVRQLCASTDHELARNANVVERNA